jgi:hypothetical protein
MGWDLQITSPIHTTETAYHLTGLVRSEADLPEGSAVRIRALASGWTQEIFLGSDGKFVSPVQLAPEAAHEYELGAFDDLGRQMTSMRVRIVHCSQDPPLRDEARAAADISSLDPPWPTCVQRIRHCLHLAATVAQETGRDRDELLQYVHAQERYAEQAHQEMNRPLYHECLANLDKYAEYLQQMRQAAQPRPLEMPPSITEEDARAHAALLRSQLAAAWKEARARARADLENRLKEIATQAQGLGRRCKSDAPSAFREADRLLADIASIQNDINGHSSTERRSPELLPMPRPVDDPTQSDYDLG